jgi:hypothetical protein
LYRKDENHSFEKIIRRRKKRTSYVYEKEEKCGLSKIGKKETRGTKVLVPISSSKLLQTLVVFVEYVYVDVCEGKTIEETNLQTNWGSRSTKVVDERSRYVSSLIKLKMSELKMFIDKRIIESEVKKALSKKVTSPLWILPRERYPLTRSIWIWIHSSSSIRQ